MVPLPWALPHTLGCGHSPRYAYPYEVYAASNGADYQMYESDINLATLGDNNKSISSITFTGGGGDIGIFAISGVVNPTPVVLAPEPAPLAALLCTLTGMILLGRRKTHR